MSGREPIRSYQRIFRPERRLHHIEGRPLPVPGGISLRSIGYAGAALLTVLVLGSGSLLIYVSVAAAAALTGAASGGRDAAAVAGAAAFGLAWALGHILGALDWPIRLVIIPAGVAVVGTQATPDGRSAHRFAAAWLRLRLAPRRRSLGRGLPAENTPRVEVAEVWVSADERGPTLRRSRLRGSGEILFAGEVSARRSRLRQGRISVSSGDGRRRARDVRLRRLGVVAGETIEVRP